MKNISGKNFTERGQHALAKICKHEAADLDELAQYRLRAAAVGLHRLGERATAEFVVEVAREYLIGTPLLAKLDRYLSRLSPELLAALGADRLPPAPIHQIRLDDN
jgi:hypothetical protein